MSFRIYGDLVGTALGAAATKDIYINTDSAYDAEIEFELNLGGNCDFDIAKASVAPTSPITPIVIYTEIYQAIATALSKTKLYEAVTAGTWLTVKSAKYFTGGKIFLFGEPNNKITLEKGSWYRVRITNTTVAAIDYSINTLMNEQPNNASLNDLF